MPEVLEVPQSAGKRFLKYASVGVSTFCLDLALLFLFADLLNVNYILSAAIAYLVAISINYFVSRRFVFAGTLRGAHTGYVIFLIIASVGLLIVTSLMYVFVGLFGIGLIASRVMVAGLVGLWNYFMNLYVNFQVAEK